MKRLALLLLLTASVAACEDAQVGERYRIERDLWKLNAQARKIGSSPRAWKALAASYEATSQRYLHPDLGSPPPGPSVVALALRAEIAAARAYATALDSLRALEVVERILARHPDIPEVVGEASWVRGMLHEGWGDLARALEDYRITVENVSPVPGGGGVEGAVLALPLHMARLASRGRESPDAGRYAWAREYYRAQVEAAPVEVGPAARHHLAEIAADLGEWNEAILLLERLEQEEAKTRTPGWHPLETRLARVANQMKAMAWGHADSASVRAAILSFQKDHPGKPVLAQALLARAEAYLDLGRPQTALRDFDRVLKDFPQSPGAARAGFERARRLESMGNWKDAFRGMRALQIEWPISPEALRVPLEIAQHHQRQGDSVAYQEALERARNSYLEFMARYPRGPHTHLARQHAIECLVQGGRYRAAVEEMLAYAQEQAGSARELHLLVEAARTAYVDLGDTALAVTTLDRIAERYPGTRLAGWASREASALRPVQDS